MNRPISLPSRTDDRTAPDPRDVTYAGTFEISRSYRAPLAIGLGALVLMPLLMVVLHTGKLALLPPLLAVVVPLIDWCGSDPARRRDARVKAAATGARLGGVR